MIKVLCKSFGNEYIFVGSAFTCGYSDSGLKSKQFSNLGSKRKEVLARSSQLQSIKSVPSSNRTKPKKQYQQRCQTEPVLSEMNSSTIYKSYRVHDDPHSDFTVLDLRKSVDLDNDEDDFHDILTDKKSMKASENSIHYSKRSQSYPINQPHGSVKVASSPENTNLLKDNIGVTLTKLEKLLGQEQNLSRKPEIFHCIGTMKTLLNSVTSPTVSVGNGNGVKCDKQVGETL